jgi:hypothetical protein
MATTTITAATTDGHVFGSDATYATARSTAAGSDDSSTKFKAGQNDGFNVWRAFMRFDTSPLAGATITGAVLKVWKESHVADSDFAMWIYRYAWAASLSANKEANFDGAYGSGTFEGELWENSSYPPDGDYVTFAVDPAGINTAGFTGYALVSSNDANDTEARGEESAVFSSADHGTAGQRPVLEIVYTPAPATGVPNSRMLMGIGI